ncbi:MAG: helix-turn-helix transcriptional regulator [Magnetococcus sp. THC-1_WYH]
MAIRRYPGHPGSVPLDSVRKVRTPERGTLAALRRTLGISQEEMAGRLGVGQAAISKIENRDDPQLNTLIRYCEALGGRLELVVTFPTQLKPQPVSMESQERFHVTLPTERNPPGTSRV